MSPNMNEQMRKALKEAREGAKLHNLVRVPLSRYPWLREGMTVTYEGPHGPTEGEVTEVDSRKDTATIAIYHDAPFDLVIMTPPHEEAEKKSEN